MTYSTKLASTDIAAVMGTATTVLGTAADPSVWDRVGTVTFTARYGVAPLPLPFGTVTDQQILANSRLNLFVVGNEYIQAGTITDNGNNSFTLSNLLRGRFGTEGNVTHGAAERVVYLNGAEIFVPIDPARLNSSFNYKAVTTNQDIANATPVAFKWTGGNMAPLSISNPRGTRDSGNDLLIEFEFRTRIGGGLRSYQSGASNEEADIGKVQILNSGSTTLPNGKERILTVIPGMQQAAVLIGDQPNQFTGITHNTSVATSARAVQEVSGPDNFVEGTLRVSTTAAYNLAAIGLQVTGGRWRGLGGEFTSLPPISPLPTPLAIPYLVTLATYDNGVSGIKQQLRVFEYGSQLFSASDDSFGSDYDPNFGWATAGANNSLFRIRFNFVGSTVRIQKAHTLTVPLTTIAASKRAAVFPVFPVAMGDKVENIILTTWPFPKTIYSASQQTEDGFTPGNPDQMDIWQESKLVGPGTKKRVTL